MRNPTHINLMPHLAVSVLTAVALSACGAGAQQTLTPSPESASESGRIVSATGEVVPDLYASLSFLTGGQVAEILVEEGDIVEAGDVIARLDTAQLEVGVLQAEAAVAVAKANLAKARSGPREEQIASAERAVAAANAQISAAAARRDALYSGITEDQILQAQYELDQATTTLADLNQSMDSIIKFAEDFPADADKVLPAGEPLHYSIELAELRVAAAQSTLNDLLDGPDPDLLSLENARIAVAAAQRDAALARLELLKAGTRPEDIDVAEANLDQAEADLAAAKARLAQASLTAPFGGTVSLINIQLNEFVTPGQPIIDLADLSGLRVETTDLNEIDVARVEVGASVVVTFDALPDEVPGTVTRISPKSEEGTGVNYTVVVELGETPEQLRWGMTAFVDISVSE